MTTPLANAVTALHASLTETAGVTVTYSQGGTNTIIQAAIPGRTSVEAQFADGSVRTEKLFDWIVSQDALPGMKPTKGDVIDWEGRRYEVLHPAGGKVYEEVGPYQQLFRIHTRQVHGG
jgi:hypothetical protein